MGGETGDDGFVLSSRPTSVTLDAMTAEPLPTNVGRERGGAGGGTHSSGAKERRRGHRDGGGEARSKAVERKFRTPSPLPVLF